MEHIAGGAPHDARPRKLEDLTARELADGFWLACLENRAEQPTVRAHTDPEEPRVPLPSSPESVVEDDPPAVPEPEIEFGPVTPPPPSPGSWPAPEPAPRAVTAPVPVEPRAVRRPPNLALARAMRPFKRTVPSTRDKVLDEEATAEWALTDDRWLPVFRDAQERRWEVVLVLDDSPSMAFWWDRATAFGNVLAHHGAFRNVQTRLLGANERGECTLRGVGPDASRRSPRDLLEPSGRRIVLMVTDGCAPMWQNGKALSALRVWALGLPVALIHLMPWPMWRQTGIDVHRLRLRAAEPGAANGRLHWERQPEAGLFDDALPAHAVPVPVLELEPSWLASWARLLAGPRTAWTNLPALLLGPDPTPVHSGSGNHTPPAKRVADFRAMVSPVAFELATYLAAAPLNLGVIERVRQVMLPDSHPANLSEIMASGLLTPLAKREDVADQSRVTFTFPPGVREELLASGRQTTTALAMRVAEDEFAAHVPAVRGLGDVLERRSYRDVHRAVTAMSVPFALAEVAALEALSGPHLALAARLRAQLAEYPESDRSQFTASSGWSTAESSPPGDPLLSRPLPADPAAHPHAPPGKAGARMSPEDDNSIARKPGGVDVTTTDPRSQTRSSGQQVVWGGVPPRNPNFTGRGELLRQLDASLGPGATAAVLPQALHGMGGVGKSQLAVEYAYRHQSDFDVIWWIPAERTVQIQGALVELGQRLNLGVGAEANVAVQRVLDALRGGPGWQVPPNWLLVFDNAEAPEDVLPFLPTGGPGRILVTSRNSRWLTMAHGLEVDVFEREESKSLLRRRGPDLTDDEADRLAEALGDLPLAVEQAAAWRAETGMPADEYLELLSEQLIELLNMSQPVDYGRPVAAAWNLSLQQLESRNPAALRVLQLAAFLAPEPIARSMFSNGRGLAIMPDLDRALRDRLRLNEAIRDINRFALARIDHRTNSIQMHRLVQQVLINQMSPTEQTTMRRGAHLLLAASDPNAPADSDLWPRYGELYPHVTTSEAIKSDDPGVRDLVYNLAQYLFHWGDHRAAADFSQLVYDTWRERLGDEHNETLRIGRWLGYMLWSEGRYEDATDLDNRILEICNRVLGEQNEGTIDAMNNVAGDLRASGEFVSALALSEDIHRRSLRSFGEDDPLTLGAAHNLGVSLRLAGRFAEAKEVDERTWQRKVQIFGADHVLSLVTEIGLAIDTRELGDYLGARTKQEDIFARFRQAHGPLHPRTLRVVRLLAEMRRKAGDHKAAMVAAKEAVAGLTTRYDEYHPEAMAATVCLSIELRHAGEYEEARRLADGVVERYRSRLGADHPHTLAAMLNQGVVLRLLDEHEAARAIDEASVAGLRERLGAEHPSTLAATVNLANDLFLVGDVAGARQLDTRTRAVCERVFGPAHPTTLACAANLAQDLAATGDEVEGQALHDEVVRSITAQLGENHPAVVEFTDGTRRANCDIDPLPL